MFHTSSPALISIVLFIAQCSAATGDGIVPDCCGIHKSANGIITGWNHVGDDLELKSFLDTQVPVGTGVATRRGAPLYQCPAAFDTWFVSAFTDDKKDSRIQDAYVAKCAPTSKECCDLSIAQFGDASNDGPFHGIFKSCAPNALTCPP